MKTTLKRLGLTVAAVVSGIAATVAVAPAAQAWEGDGRCESGEVCLHWGSNFTGSYRDYLGSEWDFAGDRFLSAGSGRGSAVKNNSASATNRSGQGATIYYNEGYTGPRDYVAPYSRRNLYNTRNDNASMTHYPCSWNCGT
ncbi:MAG TPA: peptidase inhibitor family I36 protein [Jiangellaceae bacterium]